MKRIGALFLTFIIIAVSMVGMWVYHSWKDEKGLSANGEIKNLYIVKEKGDSIQIYTGKEKKEYRVKADIKEQEYRGIGDVCIRKNEVEKLVKKPEIIRGEVLAVETGSVDVADYGTLPLDKEYHCFSVSEEITGSSIDSLYIGQTDVEFAVADGKICGIMFRGEGKQEETISGEENIRVILKTENFSGYEHSSVTLRGTKKIVVKEGKEKREYQPGESITFSPESMKEKRISVSGEEGGRIEISSLKRSQGVPLYRGKIEIVKAEVGLHIINDLPLEEYLYGVVPSEMPAEYAPEALKAQAVCARSYAVLHMKNNRLKDMGAHVDDSVSYQVYNNTAEDERCNQAVDATRGKKAYYEGKVACTYFFSTSCGVTTSAKDVSFSTKELPYLTGKLQEPELSDGDKAERAKLVSDTYGNEELFRKFLEEDRDVLDKSQPWYRWSTTISLGDIESNINSRIGERCRTSGGKIQIRQADGTYTPGEIDSIGKLKRIRIKTRGRGGVVYMAVIVGTEATVRVYSEYNIRTLIFNENAIIKKNDGKSISGMNMLPSGFFVLERSGDSYVIQGGGFGHGTGMSQTGANELAQAGKNCEEIMTYYFEGVEIRA